MPHDHLSNNKIVIRDYKKWSSSPVMEFLYEIKNKV
jgi:hypothetical protein